MEPVHCLRVDGLTGTLYFEVMDSHFFQDEYFFQVDSQRQNQEMFSHRLQRQDLPCASRNPGNKLVMLKIMASFSFWLLLIQIFSFLSLPERGPTIRRGQETERHLPIPEAFLTWQGLPEADRKH